MVIPFKDLHVTPVNPTYYGGSREDCADNQRSKSEKENGIESKASRNEKVSNDTPPRTISRSVQLL